jgi:hypothetical protein
LLAIGTLLLGLLPTAVRADLPPFGGGGINRYLREQVDQEDRGKAGRIRGVPVVIAIDDKATEAHLIVPKKHLQNVYASLAPEKDQPILAQRAAPARSSLVFGVPLAVAFGIAGCGLLGLHNRLGVRRVVTILALFAVAGMSGAVVWAKAPRPEAAPAQYKARVVLEVVSEGETVKMILPRDMLVPPACIVPQDSP